jgi:hypothetical protein
MSLINGYLSNTRSVVAGMLIIFFVQAFLNLFYREDLYLVDILLLFIFFSSNHHHIISYHDIYLDCLQFAEWFLLILRGG